MNKKSSPRLLLESSFIYPRLDGNYSSISGMSIIDGLLLYLYTCEDSENLFTRYFHDISPNDLRDYLNARKISPEIKIDDRLCKVYYGYVKGTVKVSSRGGEEIWERRVRICNLVTEYSTDEKKNKSLKSFVAHCDCPFTHYQMWQTVPEKILEDFKDPRSIYEFPPPSVSMIICAHSAASIHKLVEEKECEDFGIFGINSNIINAIKALVGSKMWKEYPDHILNKFLRDRTFLFDPLRERLGLEKLFV
jgi:hypothetical protein